MKIGLSLICFTLGLMDLALALYWWPESVLLVVVCASAAIICWTAAFTIWLAP